MKRKGIKTLIWILVIVGILLCVYLYLTTDALKSKKQIFWKYALKNEEISHMINNDDVSNIVSRKNNNSYTIAENLYMSTNNKKYAITANTTAKNLNNIYTEVNIAKGNSNLENIKLVKKNNVFGFKIADLGDEYIVVKNDDLTELAKKMNVSNQNDFPNSINVSMIPEIFVQDQNDVDYIYDKYSKLIMSNTKRKNYRAQKNIDVKINNDTYKTIGYKISLNQNETKKILGLLCDEISNDRRTLNILSKKFKSMNLPNKYSDSEFIVANLKQYKNDINSVDTNNDKYLDIIVYADGDNIVQTNIKLDDRVIKIIYDNNNNKLNIIQEMQNTEPQNKFKINDKFFNMINLIERIEITNKVSDDKNGVETNINLLCKNENLYTYKSVTNITNEVTENTDYENSKKTIVDDMDESQLPSYYENIKNKIKEIYNQKKNVE